jgi:hypothetical protein
MGIHQSSVILPEITSSGKRNPEEEEWDSAGNYLLMNNESSR